MSFRLEMLKAAQRATALLGKNTDPLRRFVRSQQLPDGSFRNRSGQSDLYYTVFGLGCLQAIGEPLPPSLQNYLGKFGDGSQLDLVHFACLARCWATLKTRQTPLAQRLTTFPSPQTAYDCYLLCSAHQDLQVPLPNPDAWLRCIESLRSHDGAYANAAGLQFGSTLATAAAVIVLLHLGAPVPPQIAPWLLTQHHPAGGFLAMPQAPAPDLLSTAVALHALGSLGTPFDQIRQPCLNFINSLRSNDGGFHAHCADQYPDVEYTYYALLALGHLAGNETGDANFQVRNNCE